MPDVTRKQEKTSLRTAFEAASPAARKSTLSQKLRKGVTALLLASTGLATVLQFTPGLVATPAADYLAQKGFSTATLEAFQAQDVHIYDRDNPLVPFHMAGHRVRMLWSAENENLLFKTLGAPLMLGYGFRNGLNIMNNDSKLAAYSFGTTEPDAAARSIFVWPSDDRTTPEEWLEEMTGIAVKQLDFGPHSRAGMQRLLIETGLLHEIRHGDQIKSDDRTLKESDADAYSLHAAAFGTAAPSLLAEARVFIMAARAVSSMTTGDTSHASAFALQRGMENDFVRQDPLHDFSLHMQALQDSAKFAGAHHRLRGMLMDTDAIPADMDVPSAFYHLASALLDAGAAQRDNETDALSIYVHAMDYLDARAGGAVIDRRVDHSRIDVAKYITPPDPAAAAPAADPPQDPPRISAAPRKIPVAGV